MAPYHTDKTYRWPLALRFIKGAIHGAIILPMLLHAAFAVIIVVLDHNIHDLGLPASIVRNGPRSRYPWHVEANMNLLDP